MVIFDYNSNILKKITIIAHYLWNRFISESIVLNYDMYTKLNKRLGGKRSLCKKVIGLSFQHMVIFIKKISINEVVCNYLQGNTR